MLPVGVWPHFISNNSYLLTPLPITNQVAVIDAFTNLLPYEFGISLPGGDFSSGRGIFIRPGWFWATCSSSVFSCSRQRGRLAYSDQCTSGARFGGDRFGETGSGMDLHAEMHA